MKKSELKPLDIVVTESGNVYMVGEDNIVREHGFVRLSSYAEDLTNDRGFCIDKVYRAPNGVLGALTLDPFNQGNYNLIWERYKALDISIGSYKVGFRELGISVGCQEIPKEKIKEIYEMVTREALTPEVLDGDVVETASEGHYVKVGDKYIAKYGHNNAKLYDENLLTIRRSVKSFDIVKIYRVTYEGYGDFSLFPFNEGRLVLSWTRPAVRLSEDYEVSLTEGGIVCGGINISRETVEAIYNHFFGA